MRLQRLRPWLAAIAILALLLAGVAVLAPNQATAQSSSIEASEDAHLLKKSGKGANETLLAIRGPGNDETWAIVKFLNVPAGTATLTITPTLIRTGNFLLYSTGCGWSEATVTWNNKPAPLPGTATLLDTKPQALPTVTFSAGTLAGGTHCFYILSSNGQSQASQVASRTDATRPGPTLNPSTSPTTTTAAPTTTTSAPTTTTSAPTTTAGPTTTTLPPPNCLLTSSFANPQAAVNATPSGGCLTVDGFYTLTSPVSLTRPMLVQCLSAANGFTSPGSAWTLVSIANVSDLTFTGCKLESSGPTVAASIGVDVGGNISRVVVSNLVGRNLEAGIVGGAINANGDGTPGSSLKVLGNDLRFLYATGVGFYGNQTRDIEVGGNTIVDHQRSGAAGQAGIQSGGIGPTENLDKHSRWSIHDNTVQASCNSSDLVGIGMDQLSSSVIRDNLVDQTTVCPSEGIVVNGPNNTVLRNRVLNVGAGAYTFISYGTPPQQVRNLVFQGNLADGNNINGQAGQGVALSFAPNALPMTGLLLGGPNPEDANTLREEQFGIQAYSFGGTVTGSGNTIQGNDLRFNISGPCSIPGGLQYTSINNNPGC